MPTLAHHTVTTPHRFRTKRLCAGAIEVCYASVMAYVPDAEFHIPAARGRGKAAGRGADVAVEDVPPRGRGRGRGRAGRAPDLD